jgi:hypothetical protein
MLYAFRLRPGFPTAHIAALAEHRAFDDAALIKIGRHSRNAGYYTRDDFLVLCESATSGKLCTTNPPERIKRHTAACIAAVTERRRIFSLMGLSGVSWHTASVLLHFTFEDRYPTLSRQSLWSWGYNLKIGAVTFDFWSAYVEASRVLAQECSVSMRDLDRALRQFATEQKELALSRSRARWPD